tara:strand:- start:92 stop:688 length:597 start_codon:yes stop_codon:yes gene_type:complete
MAKNTGDVILRDRMQFTLSNAGDRTTLYGRIDLSSYVNPIERQGLAVKEVRFQLREPDAAGTLGNTGVWVPLGDWTGSSGSVGKIAALKVYACTRAYEQAMEVGIASPDVLCVYEVSQINGVNGTGDSAIWINENWYGPKDLHPEGYTVVSDLLVGVAADNWARDADDTLEIDIMLIAEPVKISTDRMNEILSQAQDL